MQNSELVEMGLVRQAPVLPGARSVACGKGFKSVQCFSGSMAAADIKDKLARGGLKGKALKCAVNQALRGERSLREQLCVAYTQSLLQAGFVPDKGETGKSSAVIRFRLVPEVAAPAVKAVVVAPTDEQIALALGITVEAVTVLKAAKGGTKA